MSREEGVREIIEHQKLVGECIAKIRAMLQQRRYTHDASKLKEPELTGFTEISNALKDVTYGSEEYKKGLAQLQPAILHHYQGNRHHPEHFATGMAGMTLVDLVEMFCDWCASTYRHDDGNIYHSVEVNKKRFGYAGQLTAIFENTARELQIGKGA